MTSLQKEKDNLKDRCEGYLVDQEKDCTQIAKLKEALCK